MEQGRQDRLHKEGLPEADELLSDPSESTGGAPGGKGETTLQAVAQNAADHLLSDAQRSQVQFLQDEKTATVTEALPPVSLPLPLSLNEPPAQADLSAPSERFELLTGTTADPVGGTSDQGSSQDARPVSGLSSVQNVSMDKSGAGQPVQQSNYQSNYQPSYESTYQSTYQAPYYYSANQTETQLSHSTSQSVHHVSNHITERASRKRAVPISGAGKTVKSRFFPKSTSKNKGSKRAWSKPSQKPKVSRNKPHPSVKKTIRTNRLAVSVKTVQTRSALKLTLRLYLR